MHATTEAQDAATPLNGLTVIEIGHSVAAPFAAQVLADLGARVIKVENPKGGDDARSWGPPFWNGVSATFQTLNRNKSSLAVDLKDAAAQQMLRQLMSEADVVVQNMRPGLVEKLGIDADAMCTANPRLIYCNLGAFGSVGPLAKHSGYDPLVQAFSGIMSVTGEAGRPPVRVGPSIIDMGSGLWCVVGILAALTRRNATGQGCKIDTSLYEAALAWMNIPLANAMASGKEGGRSGSETPMLAPYKAFQASDKYIVIAAGNDNLFAKLCNVLGCEGWVSDPRFASNKDRVANRAALNEAIENLTRQRTAQEWSDALSAVGVPCAPMQTTSEVIAHPQTAALGMLESTPDGAMTLVSSPLRFNGVRPGIRSAAPSVGESKT
jgi:crotonobetainyl-CoA:carnitine CoA-transferase CaiB-like acyl-CoA transferase